MMLHLIDEKRIEYLSKKRPQFLSGKWYWECAYADAFDKPSMLPSYIYDEIYPWYAYSPGQGRKIFKTYKSAMKAFNRAVHKYLKQESSFVLGQFPKGWF